jgi:DNA-binding IclR family transcriptional regulator
MSNGDSSILVLDKAVGLLDLLARNGDLTSAEIAKELGEPRSSVYRLLASLQLHEMVQPGPERGHFRLGLHLLALGGSAVARLDEREAALPAMERLHAETGETVFLCVRRKLEAVCIERIEGERVRSLALRLGGALPLYVGAAPRALLAYEAENLWEEVSAGVLDRPTRMAPATRRELLPMLREVREKGFAISDEDVTLGIAAVAAPIFDYSGKVRAALSVSGTKPLILGDEKAMVSRVMEAAERASYALGHRSATESSQ